MPTESLCSKCTALCCRYFALQIDEPETPADFDDIRWYLAHESVHVFVEDGDWYLSVQTRCTFLREDNKCGIYEDRPKICREFTTDNCDYHSEDYGFEQYFTKPQQLEAYAHARLGRRYEQYVLRQRLRNTGIDAKAQRRSRGKPARNGTPTVKAVLASRARTHVHGHPGRGRLSRTHLTPPAPPLVQLSISTAKG